MRYAVLVSDLESSKNQLLDIASRYKSGILDDKEAEGSILELYKDVYPDYKYVDVYSEVHRDPLISLIKSKYFKDNQTKKNLGLSQTKLGIFLILSSESTLEIKLSCLMEFIQIKENKV